MAFVDEITIGAKAGKGGDGVVRWLHLKGKEFSGPAGGNGGDGGDIYIRAVSDVLLLSRYRGSHIFTAQDGAPGASLSMNGKRGGDLIIDVPRGSIVTNESTGERFEFLQEGETKLVLKGGRGGAGNKVFKSSVNRSPERAYPGVPGEEARLHIELRLIADAGFIGLPNAGKTTLLNALTGSQAKVGAYAFTTLEPTIGMLYEFTLADIPGLIEGASGGKGLGAKFLRHISRTELLIHCISLESSSPLEDYAVVRKELRSWSQELLGKPEIVLLTKTDTRDHLYLQQISDIFISEGKKVIAVSALDDELVKKLRDYLLVTLREKNQKTTPEAPL